MSLFAPLFSSTMAASTLLTAAAQCRADLPLGRTNAGCMGSSTEQRTHPSFVNRSNGKPTYRNRRWRSRRRDSWWARPPCPPPPAGQPGSGAWCRHACGHPSLWRDSLLESDETHRMLEFLLTFALTKQDYCETKLLSRAAIGSDWSIFVCELRAIQVKLDRKSLGKIWYSFKIKAIKLLKNKIQRLTNLS